MLAWYPHGLTMGLYARARGDLLNVPDTPGSRPVTVVNGVPIVQVGPPVHHEAPPAAPVATGQPTAGQAYVPAPPTNVSQPVIEQPLIVNGAPVTRSPRRRSPESLALLALAAVALVLFFAVTSATCSAVSSDGPSYQHQSLGGSNGMGDDGTSYTGGTSPEDLLGVPAPDSQPKPDLPPVGDDHDDGELHEFWDDSVAYTVRGEALTRSQTRDDEAYGRQVSYDFSLGYPQLEGDLEHLDQINALIRESALSYYQRLYVAPDADMVALVDTVLDEDEGATALIGDTATYAVTFNSDRLISICWSHDVLYGSVFAEYLYLETLNIDLETGETYELDDVLELSEPMAQAWTDNYLRHDQNVGQLFDRDAIARGILGEGEFGNRTQAAVFVDSDGTPNLGVTFWLGNDRGISRGWWDVTLTDDLLEGARRDSAFWDLVPGA